MTSISSSHHRIITSSHHHITTSPHHHINFPHRFKANEFRQLCSLKNIMRIKKSLRLKTLIVHISNSWVQNRTVSFWTKHSIVKNLFKKQNISTSHLHNFQCSSEPSKTPSFHHNSVNFVIEILTPLNSHLVSRIIFPTASKRMNFANFAPLKT